MYIPARMTSTPIQMREIKTASHIICAATWSCLHGIASKTQLKLVYNKYLCRTIFVSIELNFFIFSDGLILWNLDFGIYDSAYQHD